MCIDTLFAVIFFSAVTGDAGRAEAQAGRAEGGTGLYWLFCIALLSSYKPCYLSRSCE